MYTTFIKRIRKIACDKHVQMRYLKINNIIIIVDRILLVKEIEIYNISRCMQIS